MELMHIMKRGPFVFYDDEQYYPWMEKIGAFRVFSATCFFNCGCRDNTFVSRLEPFLYCEPWRLSEKDFQDFENFMGMLKKECRDEYREIREILSYDLEVYYDWVDLKQVEQYHYQGKEKAPKSRLKKYVHRMKRENEKMKN